MLNLLMLSALIGPVLWYVLTEDSFFKELKEIENEEKQPLK